MKYVAYSVLLVSSVTAGIFFLFGWMVEIIDSYFYLAFGEFLRSGIYPFQAPFIYQNPTTISPPGYAILLMALMKIPHADIFLHFIQIFLLISSSFFVFKTCRYYVNTYTSVFAACLFFLLPGNLIYTSYMLTENGATFFVALFIYLVVSYMKTKKLSFLYWMCLVSAVMVLWKYSFIVYFAFCIMLFFLSKPKKILTWMIPVLTSAILLLWILFNYKTTGVIGLSDSNGIQLWNQTVWVGKLLPSDSHASMQKLRIYVPPNTELKRAYWDLQGYILSSTNNSWREVDAVLGAVARDAVREHPVEYVKNTVKIFFDLHHGRPYWHNLGMFGRDDPSYPQFCGTLWSFSFCKPIIASIYSYPIWNSYIRGATWFYDYLFPIIMAIFYSLAIVVVIKGTITERMTIALYALGVLPIAMYVHPDPRYLIPFYPCIAVISVSGISLLLKLLHTPKTRKTLAT